MPTNPDGYDKTFLEMTFNFVQRVLIVDKNNKSKLDGVSVLKVVMTLFEHYPNQINQAMPNFIGMLLAELQVQLNKKKPIVIFKSMVLQCLALGFYNNA